MNIPITKEMHYTDEGVGLLLKLYCGIYSMASLSCTCPYFHFGLTSSEVLKLVLDLELFGVTVDIIEAANLRNNPTFCVEDQAREIERIREEKKPG